VRIAILNDSHCGARNSADIFLDYFATFYSDIFFPYCDKHAIKQIIHLGDFYDQRKLVNFKALHHNRKTFLEPMRERGMTMDIIPGNHDVFYRNTNDLCSLKELLGYFVENVNIVMTPRVMDYAGCKIALLPWINQENYSDSLQFIQTCQASIIGAHLELDGFDMAKGVAAHGGMDPAIFNRFEQVWTGHYHTKSKKGNISYLGTQYEMTWSDADDAKYFHIFDTDTREITAVRNPHTIFTKIIYNDKIDSVLPVVTSATVNRKLVKVLVVAKTDLFGFDRFIDNLQKLEPFELKIAENYEEFLGANVTVDSSIETVSDTALLMDSYVEAVDTLLDKTKIKHQLRELHAEAQNLEIV